MSNDTDDTIDKETGKLTSKAVAKIMTSGVMNAANVIDRYAKVDGDVDAGDYFGVLTQRVGNIKDGDLSDLEGMLAAQAIALDNIFTRTAMLSQLNMGEYMKASQTFMNMALRAQNQCRMSIETLAEMKNPKPYIQNNRAVNQQVNNGTAPPDQSNKRRSTRECARTYTRRSKPESIKRTIKPRPIHSSPDNRG